MIRLILVLKKIRKEAFLALVTIFLTSFLGLVIVESYYWSSSSVCEICRFHPELGWETIFLPKLSLSVWQLTLI